MEKSKINYQEVSQTVDQETGEVIQQSSMKSFKVDREPDYIKLYLDDILRLKDLPKSHSSVLMAMLKGMNYYNEIVLIAGTKKRICQQLDVKMDTLNKAIHAMSKSGLIMRVDQGLYAADPNLFGRGKWEDIKKLRLSITYTPDGRMINATIDRQSEIDFPGDEK